MPSGGGLHLFGRCVLCVHTCACGMLCVHVAHATDTLGSTLHHDEPRSAVTSHFAFVILAGVTHKHLPPPFPPRPCTHLCNHTCRVHTPGDLLLLDLGPGSGHSQALQAKPVEMARLRGLQQQVCERVIESLDVNSGQLISLADPRPAVTSF